MSKKAKKIAKTAKKNAEPAVKEISSRLFGKHSPSVGHSYESIYRFYKGKKESEPCLTLRANGSYRIPLFKLIAIIIGAVSVIFLLSVCIKGITARCRIRRARKLFEEDAYGRRGPDIQF